MPDGACYARTLGTKMDAEAWLATERSLMDRDVWAPPASRKAAEEEELIDRAPPKIRGAGTAAVKRVAVPATFTEMAVITEAMPDRLKLLIVLAGFVGLRQCEHVGAPSQ